MLASYDGQYLAKEKIKISPDDRGFLFADGVYEVVRSYNGKLFHLDLHLARLQRSLQAIRLDGVDVEELAEIIEQLVKRNDLQTGDANVYLQITRGAAPRKHAFPENGVKPTIYAFASGAQRPEQQWRTGVKVILLPDTRWARCDIKSVSLLPNVLANQRAHEESAEEAVFVRDGVLTEGSHSNFAAVFNGELVTHPKSNYILPGITREVAVDLCGRIGIPVREFPIFSSELRQAEEAILLSTTVEVMPVVQIDDWKVGNGKPGPVTQRLHQAFRELAG